MHGMIITVNCFSLNKEITRKKTQNCDSFFDPELEAHITRSGTKNVGFFIEKFHPGSGRSAGRSGDTGKEQK